MKIRWLWVGAVGVAAIAGGGAAYFWFGRGGGGVNGVGPFGTELASCQEAVWGGAQMPAYIEFVGNTTWHKGDASRLEIGGTVKLLNAAGKPVGHDYDCIVRNRQVLQANLK